MAAASARAASVTYDFSTDPTADPNLAVVGNNTMPWQSSGGNPGGFLAMTYSINSQFAGIVFPDIDQGKIVSAFKFECDLRIGNPNGNSGRPADGFSISFARSTDPLLASVPDSVSNTANFAGGIPEGGSTTGIAISFDTWSGNALPDGPDIEGIIVRVDNKTVLRQALPTRNGACADPTSLQTGPYNQEYYDLGGDPMDPAAWAGLCWQPFSVELDNTGKLTVKYKNTTILDKYQTSYFPSVGRLIFAGRTGGANEQTHVDNVKLTTEAVAVDSVPPTMPANLRAVEVGAGRVLVQWDAATDNSGKVAYEVERDGVVVTGYLTETKFEDRNVKAKTSYSYKVRAVDPSLNTSAYTAALAVTTVDFVDSVGFLTAQIYDGNTATDIGSLTSDPKFPDNPDRTVFVTGLDTPNGFADNYGLRLAGAIVPPETGSYYFFLRSDDASQFFLNTTGEAIPNPLTEFPTIEETGCCGAFQEPETFDPRTTADPIPLVAGRKYGFVLLLKEGGGGDYAQVAWRKVGDTTAATALTPISGIYLSGKADPVGGKVNITQPPKDTQAIIGKAATFSVTADTFSPYTTTVLYQWYRNNALIAGATSKTYSIPVTTQADNGAKFKVLVAVPGVSATSTEATLSVVPDTFPPVIAGAGAIASDKGNTYDVGVTFDEPVDAVSASAQGNYSLSAGTITGIKFYPGSPGVVLKASGLTPGNTYTVTVQNVADALGNKMTSASKSFTISPMKWGVVGGNELGAGNAVIPVGSNGFDIYSDGMTEWATYDETTFVYEEITGDFDKVLRVEYQDQSSQWARAGLIVRDVLNFGVGRDEQGAGAAGRYQKVHVNPSGPTLTGPGTAGNNSWEGNRRLTAGGATDSAGGGGTVAYPNNWVRLQRKGQVFTIFRSFDGQAWTQLGTTTFPEPMPDKLYVGPEYSPENGNITEEGSRGMWLAKMRDYGNYPVAPPTPPSIREYSIGLNFGSDEANGNKAGTLAATDVAGVPSVAQANWNNLSLLSGTSSAIVADAAGTAEATSVAVTWTSANTWSSTGRGEENNALTGADKALMTGYLDTGAATTSTVSIVSIPSKLTDKGYDVYVYTLGGVGGRGGSFRIWDASTGLVLRDSIRAQSPTNAPSYVEVDPNLGASGNGAGTLLFGAGNYMVFKGLTAPNIIVEARTAAAGGGVGFSGTPRAPINAIQLVAPSVGPVIDDVILPIDVITVTSPTSRSPAAEQVANAIDNNILTKFLDFNDGDSIAPFTGPVGFTVKSSLGGSVVTGLALTSANDAPERDPANYKLEGSNDGTTFTLISEGAVPAFAKRFTRQVISFSNTAAYTSYRFTVANVANNATANSMQIAEVEFLGTVTMPTPKITGLARNPDGTLTLTWTGGGTLQAAPAVTGPWTDVPGATSPYTLTPDQATLFGRIKK